MATPSSTRSTAIWRVQGWPAEARAQRISTFSALQRRQRGRGQARSRRIRFKSWEEYYAAYSPDDQMVLFDRVPSGGIMYANPNAEMFFVPLGSAPGAGTAVRLAANDPVACTNKTSPGVNNHFPKWAPAAGTYNNRTYYWVIYSSNRAGITPVTGPKATARCARDFAALPDRYFGRGRDL
jgi:hypothetical protein